MEYNKGAQSERSTIRALYCKISLKLHEESEMKVQPNTDSSTSLTIVSKNRVNHIKLTIAIPGTCSEHLGCSEINVENAGVEM